MGFHRSLPGVGWVSLVPTGATPTPIHLATVSSANFSEKQTTAPLKDADGYTIDSFVTSTDVSGDLSLSDFSNSLLACVSRGVTITAGQKIGASHAATIPTTPFEITVTQGATFADDMGVMNLTDGKAMTRGATATGTNVYAVNTATGVYTFNTADAGDSVLIMYRYTAASSGTTAEVAKAVTGSAAPRFAIHVYQPRVTSKEWGFYIPNAEIPELSASFKREGWSDVKITWNAILDPTNKLFYSYGPG